VAAARHNGLAELFMESGVGPMVLARRITPDLSFLAMEHVGDRSLYQLISDHDHGHGGNVGQWTPMVPIFIGLPLMVDMLRHVAAMEEVGMVHGELDDRTIHLVDYDSRTVFTHIDATCSLTGDGGELSCELVDNMVGSAFLHAPEMEFGVPTHISNNVWQLGLIFSKMLMGGDWLTKSAARGSAGQLDDKTQEGREEIRKFIRESFSKGSAKGFSGLHGQYADVLKMIGLMLEKDPRKRLSVHLALQTVEGIAKRRGIKVAPRPKRRAVPLEDAEDAPSR